MSEFEHEGEAATVDDAGDVTDADETTDEDGAGGGRRWLLVAAVVLVAVAMVAVWRRRDGDAGLEAPF